MAKYSNIKGFTVQTVSSDPVASQISGGSWSAGGNLPGARDETTGGGTLTAGILFGGYDPSGSAYKAEAFEYNGTAWSEGGDMSNARSNFGGLGTQTAALAIGGQNPGLSPYPFNGSEEYDGSSWTTGGTLPGGFDGNYGCTGTQTAGLQIGGTKIPNTKQVKTLSYNGTAWSDTGHDVPTAVDRNGATGTSTAAMSGGGRAPSATNAFFTYNGSSWTAITNYPASGYHFQLQGPYTDVIASGGYPLNANANWWDGTSWTTAPSMSNNHGQSAKANSTAGATSGDGFVAGADPSGFNGTEHWNSAPPVFTKQVEGQLFFNSTANAFKETITDIPATTWSTGGAMNAVHGTGGAGGGTSLTAAISFAGNAPGYVTITEQYNGSTWTEVNDMNTGAGELGGSGTYTAAIAVGGATPGGVSAKTESWDGTNWTEVNDLNSATDNLCSSAGTATAAIEAGGATGGAYSTKNESWDGTSWTEVNNLNTARGLMAESGTQTAAIIASGIFGPPYALPKAVELWDGTSWTETTEINTSRYRQFGNGTQTSALVFGGQAGNPPGGGTGYPPAGNTANTELWNGTSWTEVNNLGTARYNGSSLPGSGASSSIAAGGHTSTGVTNTEEWNASLANKTITSS